MTRNTFGPIEVFRAGTFSPMEGQTATITEENLREIAGGYDAQSSPAPVVIGHPSLDAPAYGWVDQLYVEGGKLKATIKDTVAQFSDMVKEGRYRKVSIALFGATHSANPKPGAMYLKHVGFLGAAAPAVPGLQPVQFADGQGHVMNFSQDAAHILSMSAKDMSELEMLRQQKRADSIERLMDDGRVLPAFREELLHFASTLDTAQTLSFSDGSASQQEWFLSYLARQPKVVSFGKTDIGENFWEAGAKTVAVPNGYTIDPGKNELYHRAREIQRTKEISFADAVDLATKA